MDGLAGSELLQLALRSAGALAIGTPTTVMVLRRLLAGSEVVSKAFWEMVASPLIEDNADRAALRGALRERKTEKSLAALDAGEEALVRRAALAQINGIVRSQENREAIASIAIEELRSNPSESNEAPSDDFLNRFERLAQDASSEQMRRLFASILAGEIRKPGSFSLGTLHVLSIMDARLAATITEVGRYVSRSDFIPNSGPFTQGHLMVLAHTLEDLGLVRSRLLSMHPQFSRAGVLDVPHRGVVVRLWGEAGAAFDLPIFQVTDIGREVFGLVDATVTPDSTAQLIAAYKAIPSVSKAEAQKAWATMDFTKSGATREL